MTAALVLVVVCWSSSTLAYTLPSRAEEAAREHHRMGYAQPMISAGPLVPVPVAPVYNNHYNNYYYRRPTPPPLKPKSQMFQAPANFGVDPSTGGTGSAAPGGKTGLSYINNLLSGVNKKIYGPNNSGSLPSVPFEPPADVTNTGRWPGSDNTGSGPLDPGSSFDFPNANTDTGLGPQPGSGVGGFPGGAGGSPTDIFGPGLTPVALDIADPSDNASPGATNVPTDIPGVIINNAPSQPPTPLPVQPNPDPMQTWFWPDDVVTGPLPSIQFGTPNSGNGQLQAQGNTRVPGVQNPQQPRRVMSFLQRGQSAQTLLQEPADLAQLQTLSEQRPPAAEQPVLLPVGVDGQQAEPLGIVRRQAEAQGHVVVKQQSRTATLPPVLQPHVVVKDQSRTATLPPVVQPHVVVKDQSRTATLPPVAQPHVVVKQQSRTATLPPVVQPHVVVKQQSRTATLPHGVQPHVVVKQQSRTVTLPPAVQPHVVVKQQSRTATLPHGVQPHVVFIQQSRTAELPESHDEPSAA